MVEIVHRARARDVEPRERATAGRSVFDDAGEWIGTASSYGAVFDADGVQWPGGEIVDFHGARVGHL